MSLANNLIGFLYNLELKITDAEAHLELANAELNVINKASRKYAETIIEVKNWEFYVQELKKVYESEKKRLDEICEKYNPSQKTIWRMYFIERKTYQEIATATNYSRDRIKQIIKILKNDMGGYFD